MMEVEEISGELSLTLGHVLQRQQKDNLSNEQTDSRCLAVVVVAKTGFRLDRRIPASIIFFCVNARLSSCLLFCDYSIFSWKLRVLHLSASVSLRLRQGPIHST